MRRKLRFADKNKGISDVELKSMKARIDNGNQVELECYRKKIIDELDRKEDRKRPDVHRNNQNSRFANRSDRDDFRRNDPRRQNNHQLRGGGSRNNFQDRNRSDINRKPPRQAGPDEFRVCGVERALFFPKSIIK